MYTSKVLSIEKSKIFSTIRKTTKLFLRFPFSSFHGNVLDSLP